MHEEAAAFFGASLIDNRGAVGGVSGRTGTTTYGIYPVFGPDLPVCGRFSRVDRNACLNHWMTGQEWLNCLRWFRDQLVPRRLGVCLMALKGTVRLVVCCCGFVPEFPSLAIFIKCQILKNNVFTKSPFFTKVLKIDLQSSNFNLRRAISFKVCKPGPVV